MYRVGLVVGYLGWVDFEFGHSFVCAVLLGQMVIWWNWLCCWSRWWNTLIKVNPTQVCDHQSQPVGISKYSLAYLKLNLVSKALYFLIS